jgi:hypothetical protein
LEVHSMFEPSRLEQECLSRAYAQVVPILRRRMRLAPLPPPQAMQAERKVP